MHAPYGAHQGLCVDDLLVPSTLHLLENQDADTEETFNTVPSAFLVTHGSQCLQVCVELNSSTWEKKKGLLWSRVHSSEAALKHLPIGQTKVFFKELSLCLWSLVQIHVQL